MHGELTCSASSLEPPPLSQATRRATEGDGRGARGRGPSPRRRPARSLPSPVSNCPCPFFAPPECGDGAPRVASPPIYVVCRHDLYITAHATPRSPARTPRRSVSRARKIYSCTAECAPARNGGHTNGTSCTESALARPLVHTHTSRVLVASQIAPPTKLHPIKRSRTRRPVPRGTRKYSSVSCRPSLSHPHAPCLSHSADMPATNRCTPRHPRATAHGQTPLPT
jgi:hypothetical protein